MNRKLMAAASAGLVALMLAASLWAGSNLPADMRLPIHWGLDGQPDGWAGKWEALLLPPGMAAALSLLFYALPALEPRKEGLARSGGLYLWGWAAILLMSLVIEVAVLSPALGWGIAVDRLIVGGLGVMLALIGNQLGKSRSMYMIGLRTPWTLASEEVWIRTHRLAGKLMVLAGAVILVAALVALPPGVLAAVTLVALLISAGVPIVWSWMLWRREGRPSDAGGPS
jgi:uncharacterized membrane protein